MECCFMTQLLFDIYAAQNVWASVVNAKRKMVGRFRCVFKFLAMLWCILIPSV